MAKKRVRGGKFVGFHENWILKVYKLGLIVMVICKLHIGLWSFVVGLVTSYLQMYNNYYDISYVEIRKRENILEEFWQWKVIILKNVYYISTKIIYFFSIANFESPFTVNYCVIR